MTKKYPEKDAIRYSVARNTLVKVLPKPLLNFGINSLCFETDVMDFLFSRKGELTPPCKMRIKVGPFIDPRYYEANGEQFFDYLKSLCELKTDAKILDVGCGYGQLVAPLSNYLDSSASYKGFDIIGPMIDWCQKKITPKHPHFSFTFADVFNKQYNPLGRQKASEYKFPYDDETFDVVFLKSVFTHMLPLDMTNYLSEISRVLKKGGRCLMSYFLLNPEAKDLINTHMSSLHFSHVIEGCRVNDIANPEIAVAYEEDYIRNFYAKLGLRIVEPISYGLWCGRNRYLSYQDIVVASKL